MVWYQILVDYFLGIIGSFYWFYQRRSYVFIWLIKFEIRFVRYLMVKYFGLYFCYEEWDWFNFDIIIINFEVVMLIFLIIGWYY